MRTLHVMSLVAIVASAGLIGVNNSNAAEKIDSSTTQHISAHIKGEAKLALGKAIMGMSEEDFLSLGIGTKVEPLPKPYQRFYDLSKTDRQVAENCKLFTSQNGERVISETNRCYKATQSFAGETVEAYYLFKSNLYSINIKFPQARISQSACMQDMINVAKAIAQDYGQFDTAPNLNDKLKIVQILAARKKVGDNQIVMVWAALTELCTREIRFETQ